MKTVEDRISDDELCQNKKCTRTWKVRLRQAARWVYLCNDCADYLLDLRKQDGPERLRGAKADKFAQSCHKLQSVK